MAVQHAGGGRGGKGGRSTKESRRREMKTFRNKMAQTTSREPKVTVNRRFT